MHFYGSIEGAATVLRRSLLLLSLNVPVLGLSSDHLFLDETVCDFRVGGHWALVILDAKTPQDLRRYEVLSLENPGEPTWVDLGESISGGQAPPHYLGPECFAATPDFRKIAIAHDGMVKLIFPEEGVCRNVWGEGDCARPKWSRDGKWIAWIADNEITEQTSVHVRRGVPYDAETDIRPLSQGADLKKLVLIEAPGHLRAIEGSLPPWDSDEPKAPEGEVEFWNSGWQGKLVGLTKIDLENWIAEIEEEGSPQRVIYLIKTISGKDPYRKLLGFRRPRHIDDGPYRGVGQRSAGVLKQCRQILSYGVAKTGELSLNKF